MTGKRFTYLDASRNKYIGSFFCNGVPLTNDEVVDLLNEQDQQITELEAIIRQCKIELTYDAPKSLQKRLEEILL